MNYITNFSNRAISCPEIPGSCQTCVAERRLSIESREKHVY